jgi:hypothetical protein
MFICHYLVFSSCITSNIALYVSLYVLFIVVPLYLFIYMLFLYCVQMFFFFSVFKTFIVLVMLPYAYLVFNIIFEHPELPLLLFLIVRMRSLYLVWNVRPVCHIYFIGQSIHLVWYKPLFSYLFLCCQSFIRFCVVICSECDFYLCFFKKFCNFLCLLSAIYIDDTFCCLVLWASIFCYICGLLSDLCYSFCYISCYIKCLV